MFFLKTFLVLHSNDLRLSLEKKTPSNTSEYAWNPQTTVSLTEPSSNLCLVSDELSSGTVAQAGQNLRYYVNSKLDHQHFHNWITYQPECVDIIRRTSRGFHSWCLEARVRGTSAFRAPAGKIK